MKIQLELEYFLWSVDATVAFGEGEPAVQHRELYPIRTETNVRKRMCVYIDV